MVYDIGLQGYMDWKIKATDTEYGYLLVPGINNTKLRTSKHVFNFQLDQLLLCI